MRTKLFFLFQRLLGVMSIFFAASLQAAPLTWFPGPPLDSPRSGAATTIFSGNNLLIGGDSSAVQALAATNIYWTYYMSFNGSVSAGAVAVGGMVIFYGGNDGIASTSTTVGYSPSDGVTLLAPMTVARSQLGYALDRNGLAYAIGGIDDNGKPLSSAERYDQDLNTWAHIANLPTARYNFPAVFNRTNYIYIFGGRTNTSAGGEIASVLRYSVGANSWSAMAPMPVAVAGSAATLAADGKIYVVGGLSGGVATDIVQVYDPVANSWAISTPLPEALSACSIGSDTLGRLVVMGGIDADGNDVSDVWRSQLLTTPDSLPVFVSYPTISATYHVPYTSSINATGNPQPTYLLIDGPAGMQVDNYTGVITWTPQGDEIGTNAVTIRATNYAGFADWNFAITVPYPPPTAPTNLAVVAVTEYSVTLAWSPLDPVYGPIIYRAYLKHVLHDPRGSGSTVWYTQIGTNSDIPTMTITGLTPGLSQSYYITASGPGGTSGYAAIGATTLSPQPPTNLRVTGLTTTTITLAWDPSPGPVPIASYEVWGWINGGISSAIYGTGITTTTFTVTGLTPGMTYEWGVRAHDAGGYASGFDYGPTVTMPAPPSLSAAAVLPDGSFQFSITEVGSVLQTVRIQASSDPGDPNSWQQIGSLLPTTNPFTFTDPNAGQYSVRFYRVIAP